MMSEIKPCPFCGSDKVTVIEGSTSRWCVAQCAECGAQSGEVRKECPVSSVQTGDMRKAIEEWNARAAPAAVPDCFWPLVYADSALSYIREHHPAVYAECGDDEKFAAERKAVIAAAHKEVE